MARRFIRSTCFHRSHLVPVAMIYRGWQFWKGCWGHMMKCTVCGHKKLYVYITPRFYRQIA